MAGEARAGRRSEGRTPVFPLPVSAAMSTSPPPRMSGTASAWMSVGSLCSSEVRRRGSDREGGRWWVEGRERKRSV